MIIQVACGIIYDAKQNVAKGEAKYRLNFGE